VITAVFLLQRCVLEANNKRVPEIWIYNGGWIGGSAHAARANRSGARQRDVAQVAVGVLVGEVAQLGTLRYLPIRKLYVPVFERLRVHQFSRETVSCQSTNDTFQGYSFYRAMLRIRGTVL